MSNTIAYPTTQRSAQASAGRRWLQFGVLGSLLVSLAGCAGVDALADGVKSINPFAEEEQLLPGARREALPSSDPLVVTGGKTASIAPAAAFSNWNNASGNNANNPGHVSL